MASAFTKVVANFITNLTSNIAIGSTTASIASNLTKEGVSIPDGRYCFTVNQGKSNEQHFICNVVGTAITGIQNVDRLGNLTDGAAQSAKINDEIKITDYVNLKYLVDDVEALNAIIAGLIVAGAPDASTTVKGVVRLTDSPDKTLGTATITIASPAVVTLNSHGLTVDDSIRFTTTGALPTGLTVGVKYFVISAGLTSNTFRLSATQGGTAINTSGTQSGVHTLIRTTPRAVGENDTTILPTTGEKAALASAQGTPSLTNRYLNEDTASDAGNDQSQGTQNSSVEVGEANSTLRKNKYAQSFTAAKTKIRGVKLYKAADTGTFTGTVSVALQADSAGSPSGSDLASKTFTNAEWIALSAGEITALFSSEYASMTAGSLYWIVITCSTADTSNHPNLGINTAGGYASGSTKYWNTTDGWVANGSNDLYFKTLLGTASQVVKTDTTGKIPSDFFDVSKMPVPMFEQHIALANTTYGNVVNGVGVSKDGSVIIVCNQGGNGLERYERDTITGQYVLTHWANSNANGTDYKGIVVLGSYVYIFYDAGTNVGCYRYNLADLSSETAMTITTPIAASGTAVIAAWTDGVFFYVVSNTAATTTVKLSLAGTTFTQVTTTTNAGSVYFTSPFSGSTFDGVNIYSVTPNVAQIQPITTTGNGMRINKLTDAMGAAITSSTDKFVTGFSDVSMSNVNTCFLVPIDSNRAYIGAFYTVYNATAAIKRVMFLMPVSKP